MARLVLVLLVVGLTVSPTAASARQPIIVFFGDSLTAGLHASRPEYTYRSRLMQWMWETPDGGPSAAVVQHTLGLLDDAQRHLPLVLSAKPTLVFMELGHHDVWADETQLAQAESRYADILDRLLASGAEVVPATLVWLGYRPGTPEYAAALRINQIIRRLAAERGLVLADLWAATAGRPELISTPAAPSYFEPYVGDYLHPNDAGHHVIAVTFWRTYLVLRSRPVTSTAEGSR